MYEPPQAPRVQWLRITVVLRRAMDCCTVMRILLRAVSLASVQCSSSRGSVWRRGTDVSQVRIDPQAVSNSQTVAVCERGEQMMPKKKTCSVPMSWLWSKLADEINMPFAIKTGAEFELSREKNCSMLSNRALVWATIWSWKLWEESQAGRDWWDQQDCNERFQAAIWCCWIWTSLKRTE